MNKILEEVEESVVDASGTFYDMESCRLAIASAFQMAEGISDEGASEATKLRMDWRYGLFLPDQNPGIPAIRFCEFRQNLFTSETSLLEYSVLLQSLFQNGLQGLANYSSRVSISELSTICLISQYEYLLKIMKNAIKYLNKMEPGKKQQIILPYWFENYSSINLPNLYSNQQQFNEESNQLGRDIAFLLVTVKENGVSELEESREIRGLDLLFSGLMEYQDDRYTWKKPNCLSCPFFSEEKGGELYARIH